jgi:hypothetical protein
MKITDVKGDEYELLDLVSRQSHSVHVSRVYPLWYDDTRIDPENIALRDAEEYVVDRIVDDTIDDRPKKQWTFKVHWKDYDESEDTWASWDDLKDVEALHIYLREHDQSHAIPKSHQKLMDKKPAIPKKTSTESTSPLVIEKSPPKRKR